MEEIINTFGIKWELMLFQALNFGVLLFLLHRYLYRPILKVVAERESHIKKGMKDAERASRELKSAEEERRHILTQASRDAETLADASRRALEASRADAVESLARESAAILASAQARAEEEKRRAIAESKEEIARMAVLAAERIVRKRNA
ncbi:MAG: ATP synthase F0 subunit B [Candidatus Yonathbacteria bacterium RIFOXYC1_FULL_52_10]|uniref:ATP synthase subunit b n=1 Tax=Candidatus Yonathbacteria bacterium RIFOXYD1_FULL_52_36 TaxID=1802730 RepID=A0A1G2SL17_9BACT|nr:MAG: ATP synthase F0 subunit B [Candidatus Yonathbacteria bacterium RIFOXYC1_FULL_52_10]OHA85730.1 MAG: ATP synthase F0 subunit B [Candidatus Yonathbacteria bacterium RIFOXYD1_FULL_52_36]